MLIKSCIGSQLRASCADSHAALVAIVRRQPKISSLVLLLLSPFRTGWSKHCASQFRAFILLQNTSRVLWITKKAHNGNYCTEAGPGRPNKQSHTTASNKQPLPRSSHLSSSSPPSHLCDSEPYTFVNLQSLSLRLSISSLTCPSWGFEEPTRIRLITRATRTLCSI